MLPKKCGPHRSLKTSDGLRGALFQALELNVKTRRQITPRAGSEKVGLKNTGQLLKTKGADGIQILEVIACCAAFARARGVN